MNLARTISGLMAKVPGSVKGPITFTVRATGATATSTAVFLPAHGSPTDSFKDRETIRSKARIGVVEAAPLSFPPTEGMSATWEGGTWSVMAASPLNPSGIGDPVQYRVALTR